METTKKVKESQAKYRFPQNMKTINKTIEILHGSPRHGCQNSSLLVKHLHCVALIYGSVIAFVKVIID